tara:strand:- start:1095 stop:1784 length:690 start_codon:yes stop_codon:yes gene_type:complete
MTGKMTRLNRQTNLQESLDDLLAHKNKFLQKYPYVAFLWVLAWVQISFLDFCLLKIMIIDSSFILIKHFPLDTCYHYKNLEVYMPSDSIRIGRVTGILNKIMEYELAGVVRYTHSSLMVTGPHRLPIVKFLQDQANESLQHAQQAGELLTGLDGHPSQKIAKIIETNNHSIKDILEESLAHELHALDLYKSLLEEVEGVSVYLEEYTRGLIGQEEQHQLELKKMLKDFS